MLVVYLTIKGVVMQAKHGKKELGFTVTEVLIALVILAILVAVSTRMYKQYTIRAHREDVKSKMIQIAQNLQSYKAANGSYTGAVISSPQIFGGTTYPQTGTAYYTMDLTLSNGGWVLTASTIDTTMQNNDGQVSLNDEGQKCWVKASSSCTPSAATTWDGK